MVLAKPPRWPVAIAVAEHAAQQCVDENDTRADAIGVQVQREQAFLHFTECRSLDFLAAASSAASRTVAKPGSKNCQLMVGSRPACATFGRMPSSPRRPSY